MIWDFIASMLQTPDAQPDAYTWAAALLGHFAIGVALTAAIGWAVGAWRGAVAVAIVYAIAWEGAQIALYGAVWSDSVVDSLAVGSGAVLAAGAWRNKGGAVAAALAVTGAIGWFGVRKRR